MKYGHRSVNQPVQNLITGKCYITSQNHGYVINSNTLPADWKTWFIDTPDCTILCDVLTLAKALSDKEYYVNAVFNKKIIEVGDSYVLFNFDSTKINEKIHNLIQNNKMEVGKIKYHHSNNIIRETAELLAAGKVIGWFQDGSEFGPRALGHRSILADPSIPLMKDFINSRIKFREDFRPFAPSILQEDVSEYFYFDSESPYMILVAQAKYICKQKCPEIVHANNSSMDRPVTR